MFLLLIAFQDDKSYVRGVLGSGELNLLLTKEANDDVLVFVGLELAFHWFNCEHLLGALSLHPEVVANWVLSLVLQVEGLLLWLANSHCFEVQELLNLHAFVQRDVESFSVDVDWLFLLLDTAALNIFNLKLDSLEELLFFDRVEVDRDLHILAWVKCALGWRNT